MKNFIFFQPNSRTWPRRTPSSLLHALGPLLSFSSWPRPAARLAQRASPFPSRPRGPLLGGPLLGAAAAQRASPSSARTARAHAASSALRPARQPPARAAPLSLALPAGPARQHLLLPLPFLLPRAALSFLVPVNGARPEWKPSVLRARMESAQFARAPAPFHLPQPRPPIKSEPHPFHLSLFPSALKLIAAGESTPPERKRHRRRLSEIRRHSTQP